MTRDEMLKGTRGDSASCSDALQKEWGYKMLGLLHTVPKYSILAIINTRERDAQSKD